KGDLLSEGVERFGVRCGSPVNVTVLRGSAVGTIVDNDPLPSVGIADVTVTEPDSGTVTASFPISLSAVSGQTISVTCATVFGTATASDIVARTATITFLPSQTTKPFTVPVRGDVLAE